jgi:hypothetical protein
MNIFRFQQQHTDETVPSQTSSQSGLIVWLIVHVLRRQEQQQRRNTMTNDNAIPSISETMIAN